MCIELPGLFYVQLMALRGWGWGRSAPREPSWDEDGGNLPPRRRDGAVTPDGEFPVDIATRATCSFPENSHSQVGFCIFHYILLCTSYTFLFLLFP